MAPLADPLVVLKLRARGHVVEVSVGSLAEKLKLFRGELVPDRSKDAPAIG
jgi:hypothetical protein